MKSEYFLLNKLDNSCYYAEPFPHIIIDNCLDTEIYNELVKNFPKENLFNVSIDENNIRADIFSKTVLENKNIPLIWKDFIRINSSKEFGEKILNFFAENLVNIYPNIFKSKKDVNSHRVGAKYKDSYSDYDLLTEMSIAINTPVKKVSSVREAHLDNSKKIFTSLFYMRDDIYQAKGGDLILYKWKNNYSKNKKKLIYKENMSNKNYDQTKVVNYSKNKLILFLNSIDALHGVSPRSISSDIRKFCCITCSSSYQYSSFIASSKVELLKLKILEKFKLI